jgi:hypothetical protein
MKYLLLIHLDESVMHGQPGERAGRIHAGDMAYAEWA